MVHTLTAIPSDSKSQLWDMGLDYEKISDFELFMLFAPTLPMDKTRILFGDLDFSKLKCYQNTQNDEVILADKDMGIKIDSLVYELIVNYLRRLHGLKKKVEHAANEYTKKILIEEDRKQIEMEQLTR